MKTLRVATALLSAGLLSAQEPVDLTVVHRIKAEAFKKGKSVETLSMLTDRYGPRLTASPEYDAAAEWIMSQLNGWGLSNVHTEKWGPFARSWSLRRFSMHMTSPQYSALIGFPLAWSDSTKGLVHADAVSLKVRDNDMEKFRLDLDKIKKEQAGKLKGAAVLISAPRTLALQQQAPANRLTEAELSARAIHPEPQPIKEHDYSRLALPEDPAERTAFLRDAPRGFREALNEKRK